MRATSRKQELWLSCKSELDRRKLYDEGYVVRLERETQLLTEEDAMVFLFTRQCTKEVGIRSCDTNICGTFANSLVSYLLGISELDPVKVGVSHLFFLDRINRKVIDINIPMSFADSLIKVARRLLIDGWGDVFYEVEKDNCIWACESVTSRSSLIFQNFKVLDKIQEKLEEKNMKVQDIPLDNQTIARFFKAEKGKMKHPYPFEHEYPAMILDDIEFSINGLNDLAKIMGLMHLVHAILTPSAMHEFVVTDLLTEFAVECAKRKRIHLADSLLTAANHYLSELMDDHESFFLDTEEPMWLHSSFLGIALARNKVAECNDGNESGAKYHTKADEVYRNRIERYFGDKYEVLYKTSNYDNVKWGKW